MTNKNYRRRVRSQRRTPTDLRKLSRALIALAQAQAEGTPKSETDRRRSA